MSERTYYYVQPCCSFLLTLVYVQRDDTQCTICRTFNLCTQPHWPTIVSPNALPSVRYKQVSCRNSKKIALFIVCQIYNKTYVTCELYLTVIFPTPHSHTLPTLHTQIIVSPWRWRLSFQLPIAPGATLIPTEQK